MRETVNTKAIILNRCAFRENDTRITLYSRDYGKLDLVARGTKKLKSKLAGHLEPITLSEIMIVPGKQFDYIGTADMTVSFLNIKNDLEKILLAGRAIRVFNKLVREAEKDEKLFVLMSDFLDLINKENLHIKNSDFLYSFFIFKLLSELGYCLNYRKCAKCNELFINEAVFNFKSKEVFCKKCSDFSQKSSQVILKKSLNLLALTYEAKFEKLLDFKISKESQKEYCEAADLFLRYNFLA